MADDVREWPGAESAAESFMEPLSRDYIGSRKRQSALAPIWWKHLCHLSEEPTQG